MNRHIRIFLGWPVELLGECRADRVSVEENYSVVCYEDDMTEHAFLVGHHHTVAEICRRWLIGESADRIDEEVIKT